MELLENVREEREEYTRGTIEKLEELELHIICPLTFEVMKNPCKCSDGHTYERGAIQEWMLYKNTSPSTQEKFVSKELVSDVEVKAMIYDYLYLKSTL